MAADARRYGYPPKDVPRAAAPAAPRPDGARRGRDLAYTRVRCAASAAWARCISVRKKAGVCPWNRLSAVSARTAATAPEFCVVEGRVTEQAGSPLSRKAQGSGKIRVVWNNSLS